MKPSQVKTLSKLLTAAGVPCAIGSWLITYEGLLAQSGNSPFALVLSGVAAIVSVLTVHILCRVLPDADAKVRRRVILGVGLPGPVFILLTSTSMAVLGMAAPQAQQLDMKTVLDQAEVRLEEDQIQMQRQAEAVPLLRTQADQLEARALVDEENGLLLGEKGEDARSVLDLQALSEAYGAAAEAVEEDQARRLEAAEAANQTLGQLRALVEGTQANTADLRTIEQPYLTGLRDLNVQLAQLERSVLDGDVLAPVSQVLAAQRDTPFKSTRKSRRRRQSDLDPAQLRRLRRSQAREREEKGKALGMLHDRNAQVLEDTQADLAELASEPRSSERLERRSPMEAVWEHRRAVAHLIAFPVVLDLAIPFLAIVVLSLLGSAMPRPPASPPLPEPPIHETPSPRMRLSQLRTAASGQRGPRPLH